MRADRLVAILLMLQRRDVVTAAQAAEELEVSVRTARRDFEALSMAGVPVYPQRGRGGGWRLLGGGRLDLSGLNEKEARSLVLLAGARSDVTPEVRSAMRKLVRALPEPLRQGAEAAAGAVIVDPTGWDHGTGALRRPPILDLIEAAVIDGEQIVIGYRSRDDTSSERVVHPLGLASKGRNWYLIADTAAGMRTFRVDRVTTATPTGEPVVRPDGFELTEAWSRIVAGIDQLRTPVTATGTADPESVRYLRMVFGRRLEVEGATDGGGTAVGAAVSIRLRGSNVRALANSLAGFGAWVAIHEPPELREMLGEIGEELVRTYRTGSQGPDGSHDIPASQVP